jgi:hypothetical protein
VGGLHVPAYVSFRPAFRAAHLFLSRSVLRPDGLAICFDVLSLSLVSAFAALVERSFARCFSCRFDEEFPTRFAMGASTRLIPANPLASMIIAHEGEPLFAQSEVALYRARAEELRLESAQTSWPDVRERVKKLAEEYELLADSLEPS